jgi:hypothetical protein
MLGISKGTRVRELEKEISRGLASGKVSDDMMQELDELVAGACVLCSETAIKQIDKAFFTAADNRNEWVVREHFAGRKSSRLILLQSNIVQPTIDQ